MPAIPALVEAEAPLQPILTVLKTELMVSLEIYTPKLLPNHSVIDIIALQNASTIETNFASGADHTVSVELVDASSGSCSTHASLSPAVTQNLIFTASDTGTKTSASMSSSSAYRNVKCRVTDATNSPSVVGCSTDAFAIRPLAFTVTSNMTNTGASGTPVAKAGDNFTLTATASAGYDGTPVLDNSLVQAHVGAIQPGSISGAFNAATPVSGIATGTAFNYSEVGLFNFASNGIYDSSFTAIDQSGDCSNDFSNSPVSGKVGCKFGNTSTSSFFGRFTPDHFDVTLNTPAFSPTCNTYTYVGQPVKYSARPVATITAKNSSAANTQNYTGNFWKIDPTHLTYGISPAYTEASHALSVLNANAPAFVDNGDGTGLLNFADTSNNILGIVRSTPEAEFDAEIAMSFSLTDTDGVVVANVGGTPQTNPITFGAASAGNGISFGTSKAHRWGRLVINNAHGTELIDISVPLFAEYFDGINFVANTADTCTTIALSSQLSLSNPGTAGGAAQPGNTAMLIGSGTSSATLLNSPLSSGNAGLSFSAPSAGNTGYINLNSDLSSFPWLLFDWDNDASHDDNPSGKVTFGIFSGHSKQIYFREVY